jgi:hypothetical protein
MPARLPTDLNRRKMIHKEMMNPNGDELKHDDPRGEPQGDDDDPRVIDRQREREMPARLPTDLNRKKMIHKESHSEMMMIRV